jgi:peptidoglycan pentaglycine glycine transferase (the first glycine)
MTPLSSPIYEPSVEEWDAFVRANPQGHILQLSGWAEQQASEGWYARRLVLRSASRWNPEESIQWGMQVLFKPMLRGFLTRAYCPYGPILTEGVYSLPVLAALDRIAKAERAVFLKCEPGLGDLSWHEKDQHGYITHNYRPGRTVQPPRTIVLDLREGEDALLARMNQGTRRKIRQSQKNGIRYFEAAAADVDNFVKLMHVTGERNDFYTHEAAYYRRAYDLFVPKDAALFLAEHEGDILAGVFVTHVGHTAQYLYGASIAHKRNLMASYGVQWAAIQWAMARGASWYDLWGVPDEDEAILEAQFQTRSDGLWGVYGFKRGWGGQVVRSAGAWDKPYITPLYAAFEAIIRWREKRSAPIQTNTESTDQD